MDTVFYSHLVDEFDNPVERTKYEWPYSYDAFVTYRNGENKEANLTAYSDRLRQEDSKKYMELRLKHFGSIGDYWDGYDAKAIEAFLADWMDKKVKLIFVMECCNQSSGYPYWRFDFKTYE